MGQARVFRFEDIGDELPLLPLSARRALDVAGKRLSLAAWQGLSLDQRREIALQGSGDAVDGQRVRVAIADAEPAATDIEADDESRLTAPGTELHRAIAAACGAGVAGSLDAARWSGLSKLERFALLHLASRKPARLREAYDEIAGAVGLTHLNAQGDAQMVDVGDKPITHRRAVARALVRMRPETARLVMQHAGPKGDVLATARLAAIMAAKRTSELIPLCHAIALTRVSVDFDVDVDRGSVTIKAASDARDRTGVEMEAMVAANIAALTIYDMLKAVERGVRIEHVVLLEKMGGRSGHYRYEPPEVDET